MDILLPDWITIVGLTLLLGYCAYQDIVNQTIPILWVGIALGVITALSFLSYPNQIDLMNRVFGAVIGFVPFLILALSAKGGGGDAILMGTVGWFTKAFGFCYILLFATGFYLLYFGIRCLVYVKRGIPCKQALSEQYPYAPFVLCGWILYLIFGAVL